jgi:hypothetical protein
MLNKILFLSSIISESFKVHKNHRIFIFVGLLPIFIMTSIVLYYIFDYLFIDDSIKYFHNVLNMINNNDFYSSNRGFRLNNNFIHYGTFYKDDLFFKNKIYFNKKHLYEIVEKFYFHVLRYQKSDLVVNSILAYGEYDPYDFHPANSKNKDRVGSFNNVSSSLSDELSKSSVLKYFTRQDLRDIVDIALNNYENTNRNGINPGGPKAEQTAIYSIQKKVCFLIDCVNMGDVLNRGSDKNLALFLYGMRSRAIEFDNAFNNFNQLDGVDLSTTKHLNDLSQDFVAFLIVYTSMNINIDLEQIIHIHMDQNQMTEHDYYMYNSGLVGIDNDFDVDSYQYQNWKHKVNYVSGSICSNFISSCMNNKFSFYEGDLKSFLIFNLMSINHHIHHYVDPDLKMNQAVFLQKYIDMYMENSGKDPWGIIALPPDSNVDMQFLLPFSKSQIEREFVKQQLFNNGVFFVFHDPQLFREVYENKLFLQDVDKLIPPRLVNFGRKL